MVEINSSEDWIVLDFTFPTKAVEADDADGAFFAAAALRGTAAAQESGREEGEKAVSGACVVWEVEAVVDVGCMCDWRLLGCGGEKGRGKPCRPSLLNLIINPTTNKTSTT